MTKIQNIPNFLKNWIIGIWNLFGKLFLGKLGYCFMKGFTMIEVVVMVAIVTAISSVVLFSFAGLNESGALNR